MTTDEAIIELERIIDATEDRAYPGGTAGVQEAIRGRRRIEALALAQRALAAYTPASTPSPREGKAA